MIAQHKNPIPVRIDECVPEGYIVVPEGAIPVDAINCAIYRALATISMIQLSIETGINAHILTEAVDAVEGYLNQISVLAQHIAMCEPFQREPNNDAG